jgi:2Fe-2S ferredoxin
MPKVTFIQDDGRKYDVEAVSGQSLMQAAVFNNVPGIVADCGGNSSCGTCHVYVALPWAKSLPAPGTPERVMLDSIPRRKPDSRLSCCIKVTEEFEGLKVNLPQSQYWG